MAFTSNQDLIRAMKYSNMKNGEIIIKLNDEVITAHIKNISMEMQEACYTTITLEAMIRD
jgi:hypothetical protein